jgi:hypothetical protein
MKTDLSSLLSSECLGWDMDRRRLITKDKPIYTVKYEDNWFQ